MQKQIPFPAVVMLSWAFVLMLFVVGTIWGADSLARVSSPIPYPITCCRAGGPASAPSAVGIIFRNMESLREDFEAAISTYS